MVKKLFVFQTDQLKKMSQYDRKISNSENIIPKRPKQMRFITKLDEKYWI